MILRTTITVHIMLRWHYWVERFIVHTVAAACTS